MRREFTRAVKAAIVHRAMQPDGKIKCEGCGQVLAHKRFEVDHKIAEALIIDKSAPLTAEDGQLLGYCCHRGENGKTNADVKAIAKSKRQESRYLGIRQSRRPMDGSKASRWKKPFNGPPERRT